MMMPEGWEPGQPFMIPDPDNPGKMIEVPADQLEIVASVPVGPPDDDRGFDIDGDIGPTSLDDTKENPDKKPLPAKKKKKKKQKK